MSHPSINTPTLAAIERLLDVAQGTTGQSRLVANLLLAWWNAEDFGGFDLTDLWGLDVPLRQDAVRVFAYVASHQHYPDTLGWGNAFSSIVLRWRPEYLESHGMCAPQ